MELEEFVKRGAAAQKAVNELGAGPPVADWPKEILRLDRRIAELEAALTRILGTANEPGQEGNRETQMANIATIAADALNPPWPTGSSLSDATVDRTGEPT